MPLHAASTSIISSIVVECSTPLNVIVYTQTASAVVSLLQCVPTDMPEGDHHWQYSGLSNQTTNSCRYMYTVNKILMHTCT